MCPSICWHSVYKEAAYTGKRCTGGERPYGTLKPPSQWTKNCPRNKQTNKRLLKTMLTPTSSHGPRTKGMEERDTVGWWHLWFLAWETDPKSAQAIMGRTPPVCATGPATTRSFLVKIESRCSGGLWKRKDYRNGFTSSRKISTCWQFDFKTLIVGLKPLSLQQIFYKH